MRRNASILTVLWFFFILAFIMTATATAADLTVGQYQLVSSKRIARTVWEYTYRASVTNSLQTDLIQVSATGASQRSYLQFVSNSLSFGEVAIGQTVSSSNTFTIRVDRQYSIQTSDIQWQFVYDQHAVSSSAPAIASFSDCLSQGDFQNAITFIDSSLKSSYEQLATDLGGEGLRALGRAIAQSTPVFSGQDYAEYEGVLVLPSGENIVGKFTLIKRDEGWKFNKL